TRRSSDLRERAPVPGAVPPAPAFLAAGRPRRGWSPTRATPLPARSGPRRRRSRAPRRPTGTPRSRRRRAARRPAAPAAMPGPRSRLRLQLVDDLVGAAEHRLARRGLAAPGREAKAVAIVEHAHQPADGLFAPPARRQRRGQLFARQPRRHHLLLVGQISGYRARDLRIESRRLAAREQRLRAPQPPGGGA